MNCKCGGKYTEIDTYPVVHKGSNKAVMYATYECNRCKLSISKSKE
jgi:hypothetical protein